MGVHTIWDKPAMSVAQGSKDPSAEPSLLEKHDYYFRTVLAESSDLVHAAQAVRYQVYCVERHFEDPDEHVGGLEKDAFDEISFHGLLYYRATREAIGTVRMIRASACEDDIPVKSLLRENGVNLNDHVDLSRTVEISRFAISKNFRRRSTDENGIAGSRRQVMREANLACLSLIQFLVRQSIENQITFWTGVMEPKLLRMLAGMGIRFTSIGSLVLHHGLRQPCFCEVPKMLEEVRAEYPEFWEVLTNGGEFRYPAVQASRQFVA
jgi:N-acyl amino acid synthase of PEP-CTERM/exosortase system